LYWGIFLGEVINIVMENTDYIYALTYIEDGARIIFYIGRTIDPHRRLGEHRLGSRHYKDGDEWKYQYASTLDSLNIPWEMEILMECGPGTEFYEDYFINLHRNEPLQNMKKGDDEPWMGRDYSGPSDFIKYRKAVVARQKASVPRVKVERRVDLTQPCTTRFVDDVKKEIESPSLQAIRERRAAAKKKSI
jgi:hypothetical protein